MKTARKPDYEPGSGGVIPEIWPTFQSSDSFMHIGPFCVSLLLSDKLISGSKQNSGALPFLL